jgi:endonuclease V-like protein UPF0215 family
LTQKRLHQIKKEIRVLGVSAGPEIHGYIIIGIVFRGSLWLDGVLRRRSEDPDLTDDLIDMIRSSPHSGQIRVIILSRGSLQSGVIVDPNRLNIETEKPVIFLEEPPAISGSTFTWRNGGDSIKFSIFGLSRWAAEEVLKVSTRAGVVPEVLKIATLILSALLESKQT